MPTYEYECPSCKHQFEVSQPMTAQPVNKCPKCGNKVKRLIGSGGGIIFSRSSSAVSGGIPPLAGKGSGFYATDYKKNEAPKKDSGACQGCPSAKSCPANPPK